MHRPISHRVSRDRCLAARRPSMTIELAWQEIVSHLYDNIAATATMPSTSEPS